MNANVLIAWFDLKIPSMDKLVAAPIRKEWELNILQGIFTLIKAFFNTATNWYLERELPS